MIELLTKALSQYGTKEIVGSKHNDIIVNYFKEIGHSWVKDDETAWCSAFINWCAKESGYEYTKKLNARSWLDIGCPTNNPTQGDIVVFWRGNKDGWKGHVALYISETEDYIYVLGGNQGNKVQISPYPKYRLLEYRTLNKI